MYLAPVRIRLPSGFGYPSTKHAAQGNMWPGVYYVEWLCQELLKYHIKTRDSVSSHFLGAERSTDEVLDVLNYDELTQSRVFEKA